MSSRISNICLDAADPYTQTLWWAQVLTDFSIDQGAGMSPDDEECGLTDAEGRSLLFLKVLEPKSGKNRMHLCISSVDGDRDSEVDRIVGLGATVINDLRNGERGWAVLTDPEGNEFCVLSQS